MLAPNTRTTLQDIVKPPAAYDFDAAVLCTYSARLPTLLSIPAALLAEAPETLEDVLSPASASKLLAAVRKTFRKMLVFCQESRIHGDQALSPLIYDAEAVVREVGVPNGAFHPKIWLLRFRPHDRKLLAMMRLAVLSRNLTKDPSWDVAAVLEGSPGKDSVPASVALPRLLRALEGMCRKPLPPRRSRLLRELAAEAEKVKWKAPTRLSDPVLRVGGIAGDTWVPSDYDRIAVFSPFLHAAAIDLLGKGQQKGTLLVSRPEALDSVGEAARRNFVEHYVLAPPRLGPDDLATTSDAPSVAAGLHAKIYIWDAKRRTRIAIGSANATSPALHGRNVEFMVEFDCTAAVKGGVRQLLEVSQLSKVLQPYEASAIAQPDPACLYDSRPARRALGDAELRIRCTQNSDGVALELVPSQPVDAIALAQLPGLRFWPATMPRERVAPCFDALAKGHSAPFGAPVQLAEVTRFIVFEADTPAGRETFMLMLELDGIDEAERRAAVTASILPTPERFLDFIQMLLGDLVGMSTITGQGDGAGEGGGSSRRARAGALPAVLEALVKCAADEPGRLDQIRTVLEDLAALRAQIVPAEFLTLWNQLQRALPAKHQVRAAVGAGRRTRE